MFKISPVDMVERPDDFFKALVGSFGYPNSNVNWIPWSVNLEYTHVAPVAAGEYFDLTNPSVAAISDANFAAHDLNNRSFLIGNLIVKTWISVWTGPAGGSYLYATGPTPPSGFLKSYLVEWRNISGVDLNIWGKDREFQYQPIATKYLRIITSTGVWTQNIRAMFNGVKVTY